VVPSAAFSAAWVLNRRRDLEPAVPLIRYEHAPLGDLLYLDIKQLGRVSDVIVRPDGRRRGKAAPRMRVCSCRYR
jgi:hypothetical protein